MKRRFTFTLQIILLLSLSTFCTEEQQNRLQRIGVTLLEGNYRVTFAVDGHVKSWIVRNSKVTAEPSKGYYFFWAEVDGKKVYVQTPIDRTYIEELPE